MPLISVIIPVYNGEETISEAIQSVLDQTFQDLEIIIIDDGSTDGSPNILERFCHSHPKTISTHSHAGHSNRGIVETYRLGFLRSTGKYLAFLEQDDAWPRNFLENKVKVLEEYQEVGVVFAPRKIVATRFFGLYDRLRQYSDDIALPKEKPFDCFKYLLRSNPISSFSAIVLRRELTQALPMPIGNGAPPDAWFDWWILIFASLKTLFFYDRNSFVKHRIHPRSTTSRSISEDKTRATIYRRQEELCQGLEPFLHVMSSKNKQYFKKFKEAKTHFLAFLTKPNIQTYRKFLAIDPLWSVKTLAMLLLIKLKR